MAKPVSPRTGNHTAVHRLSRSNLERRIVSARQHILVARARLHMACRAVTTAEQVLLVCRLEREDAALRLARLADMLESLEQALDNT